MVVDVESKFYKRTNGIIGSSLEYLGLDDGDIMHYFEMLEKIKLEHGGERLFQTLQGIRSKDSRLMKDESSNKYRLEKKNNNPKMIKRVIFWGDNVSQVLAPNYEQVYGLDEGYNPYDYDELRTIVMVNGKKFQSIHLVDAQRDANFRYNIAISKNNGYEYRPIILLDYETKKHLEICGIWCGNTNREKLNLSGKGIFEVREKLETSVMNEFFNV